MVRKPDNASLHTCNAQFPSLPSIYIQYTKLPCKAN